MIIVALPSTPSAPICGLRLALTIAGIILTPTLWIFQRSLRGPATQVHCAAGCDVIRNA
ncbi:MAG: hypothetical protein R2873_11080 [Caldilineaceae bacterium]